MRDSYVMAALAVGKAADVADEAAATDKPFGRRQRARSIVGGIALALLIGGGLFLVAVLNA